MTLFRPTLIPNTKEENTIINAIPATMRLQFDIIITPNDAESKIAASVDEKIGTFATISAAEGVDGLNIGSSGKC